MEISIQGLDPRVELSHFEEVIATRRKNLALEGAALAPALLLDPEDRARYLMCLFAVKQYQSVHGTRGINTLQDMVEYIELVNELSLVQTQMSAGELRQCSLDLLRSMRLDRAKRA